MKANLGSADRIVRLLIAAAVVALYFFDLINGMTATLLLIVAVVFAFTSVISFCPIYSVLHLRTNKKQ
jgi:hypothetical protein